MTEITNNKQASQHEPPKHGDHKHAFTDPADRARKWNDPERDKWQRPDEIVAALALMPGATVADIGAGTGYMVAHLSRAAGKDGAVKCNLGPKPKAVQFTVETAKTKAGSVSRIQWGEELEGVCRRDNCPTTAPPRPRQDAATKRQRCMEVMQRLLTTNGPMESRRLDELVSQVVQAHERTVREARKQAGLVSRREPGPETKWWCGLPGQDFPWEKAPREAARRWAKELQGQ